jgi:hypothetical protein
MATQQKQDSLTGLYKEGKAPNTVGGQGGLAPLLEPGPKGGFINVVKDFPWTLSPTWTKTSAPFVILKEFPVNESTIYRQTSYYASGGVDAVTNIVNSNSPLTPYEGLFPKGKGTGFRYYLPYFSDINFSVTTPEWTSLDTLEQLGGAVKQGANVLADGLGDFLAGVGTTATKIGGATLGTLYPKVGILDRPRLWREHSPRTIEIKFSLFNTLHPDDWKSNRDLCTLLINQNLYNKRDFITGLPPVFYEILVPGQHYSYAACVTNITVLNRGNMRTIRQDELGEDTFIPTAIVPDAYEIQITLTDMVVPSRNLFQQINNQEVYSRLISDTDERGIFEKAVDLGKSIL